MVERKFTVPLGGHLFKRFIDRVDLIPGTEKDVEIIDSKTGWMMRGSARTAGIGCIVGECARRFVVRVTGLLPMARISGKIGVVV